MTHKEKANQFFDKFYTEIYYWDGKGYSVDTKASVELTKRNCLIAIEEIIDIAYWEYMDSAGSEEKKYWLELKEEIKKINN